MHWATQPIPTIPISSPGIIDASNAIQVAQCLLYSTSSQTPRRPLPLTIAICFDAKFRELIHKVEHHVEEEESEMFPLAAQELSEDLDEMMEEMQELKADLQGL